MPLERPKSVSLFHLLSRQELIRSTLPMLSRRCSRASNLFIDRLECIVFDDLWYSSQSMITHMPRASPHAPQVRSEVTWVVVEPCEIGCTDYKVLHYELTTPHSCINWTS
jgi:hypothetical protein